MNRLLCIGFLVLFAGACSDNPDNISRDAFKRPVTLQVGVYPQTRAALSSLDGQKVAFAKGDASTAYTEMWEGVAHASDTRLEGEHTYPEDRSYLYLRGCYPVASLSDGQAAYLLDGQTDLLATAEQRGNFIDNFTLTDKTFYFYHLLTQCSFAIRLTKPSSDMVRLKSVRIHGSRPQASVLLAEAKPDTLPVVAFSGDPAALPVYVEPGRGEGIVLSEGVQQLPVSVLVEPGAPLTLDVELTFAGSEVKAYKGLPIHFNESDKVSRPGTAYLITIRLHPPGTPGSGEISLGVSVTPWQPGTGGGTVQ